MSDGLSLDKNQRDAVEFDSGPLLIIAGAGTGKTTVITQRINHLIVEKNISPDQILALTFTDKAAHQMQERIDVLLPYGYTNLWIHTFHSFCDRILRNDAHIIGLDNGYKLISESESILLLRQNIFDLELNIFRPLGNPNKFLDALLTHFSRLKDEDITPIEYMDWAKRQEKSDESKQYLELAESFAKYNDLKVKNSLMDFSDLISNTLLLFRKRPNILKKYQEQFKYILVDEFQDTNYAQNELAILLAGDDKNLNVVADDDQSIYRFRGAAVSNVLQFKKNFPAAKIVTLTDNYRSTQEILDSSYKLIQNNNPNRLEVVENIVKRLKSHSNKKNHEIELIKEPRAEDEADKVAQTIRELVKSGYKYNDIAVLLRANDHGQLITTAFFRHKIPFQFLGPGYLFQQEEVKDLIAYLTFLTNLSDSVSLFRVLSMEVFGISYVELNYILNFAKKRNLNLFEAISGDLPFISEGTKNKLAEFVKMVENHLIKSRKFSSGQILYDFLVDTGLFNALQKTESQNDEKKVQNIAKFFDRVKNFETERSDANIFTLVEWLTLMMQMGDSPLAADIDLRESNAVNILTVHSSKGLEFPVVFMVNLVNERFPTRERADKIPIPEALIKESLPKDTDFHLEEERRLFYVGMTRAKERLYFTAADYYGAGRRQKKLSPFVYEALPHLEKEEKIEKENKQMSLLEVLSPYQSIEEPKAEKSIYKVDYITYSNLQMFDICPLHYKAKVIFNLPTPAAAVQSFGISMHKTLYEFYKQIIDGQKPALEHLLKLLEQNWESEGYNGKKHEEERLLQARTILKNFYQEQNSKFTPPLAIEQSFNFTLKNGVKVFGKIDRIDAKDTGIEIIDYKTGLDNPKADKAHRLQLAIYALAATKVKDLISGKNPDDITLTLYFLEQGNKKSLEFESEELGKFEDELIEKIKEIESSDFKCSGNMLCKNCEFKMLCNGL
jgi:DNA helicase II / ATP-dependent DNA helicase PcrA